MRQMYENSHSSGLHGLFALASVPGERQKAWLVSRTSLYRSYHFHPGAKPPLRTTPFAYCTNVSPSLLQCFTQHGADWMLWCEHVWPIENVTVRRCGIVGGGLSLWGWALRFYVQASPSEEEAPSWRLLDASLLLTPLE